MSRTPSRRPGPPPRQVAAASPLLLVLLLITCSPDACQGAPILPLGLQPEQELQLWNEAPKALEELCFMIMGILPKPQEPDKKDNTKRFLFHYSKTQKLGNSNVVEEFQGPVASRSRGFFLFRPRNGRRSAGFS